MTKLLLPNQVEKPKPIYVTDEKWERILAEQKRHAEEREEAKSQSLK